MTYIIYVERIAEYVQDITITREKNCCSFSSLFRLENFFYQCHMIRKCHETHSYSQPFQAHWCNLFLYELHKFLPRCVSVFVQWGDSALHRFPFQQEGSCTPTPHIGNWNPLYQVESFVSLLCKKNVLHQTMEEWAAQKIRMILSTTNSSHCTNAP